MWIADKIYYQNSSNFIRAFQGDELVWDKNLVPLMFTAKANSSSVGLTKISTGQTLEYSTDGNTWSNMTTATTITLVNSGDSVFIRGVLTSDNTTSNYTQFKMSGNIKASGNINYLWNKDNPDTGLRQYCGHSLFSGCSALSDVSELELQATTLEWGCYQSMFNGCTSLTSAPELPATTLASNCYMSMFFGCTALTTAPALPATTLAERCYNQMFRGCTSLVTAPVLPATALTSNCYMSMFFGCTALTTAPALPATTLASECYRDMFWNCSSLITAPSILPATALTNYCYAYMFKGCTSLTTAPALPATILAESCYGHMFDACYGLTTPPELPATTLANSCYSHMFYGCTSLATAPSILPATTLVDYCYYGMFKSCYSLNYIKCLATDISASNCTAGWVDSVSGTGTFVKDSNMTGWTIGVDGIPSGWTIEGGPDLTKKHWWTANSGSYNFNLPTRWNNGYRVEVDQYFTGSGNTSSAGCVLRQNSDNSPLEVFYTSGFYFDAHYPNSTTSPTVNTTDYDHRVSLSRTTFNNNVQSNVKYTFKYEMTPTHAIRIYNGSTLVYQTTYNSGNKNWCTTGDYSLYVASMWARSGWCVVSDIRVYDNNNSLIHNFQLYPSPNPDVLGYEYLDIVTDTWYPVVNGEISKVETTER